MSDQKVYGYCPAGCKHEVVTMEKFQQSAPCIQIPVNSIGKTELEVGRKYKIYSKAKAAIAWNAVMTVSVTTISALTQSEILANGYYDQYRGYFYFQLFDVTYSSSNSECTAVYEVNGVRKTTVFDVPQSIQDNATKLYVEGAQKIFAVNEGANEFEVTGVGIESIAKTGTSGLVDTYTITLTNGETYTFTVTNGSGGGGSASWGSISGTLANQTDLKQALDAKASLDLGITGATTGKVAKISAVGANGRPTAWTYADMPTALKNPNALTIKVGDTTVVYDGSTAKTVEIADGTEVSY